MSDISYGYVRGKLPKEDRVAQAAVEAAPSASVNVNPLSDTSTLTQAEIAKASGFTGDTCSNCQGVHMQIAGHCMVCADCGTTTGCS